MYICDFSRSEGAGRATTRKTRGLTRSVRARIVPPLPAASRPSKTMMTRSPLCLTHSCRMQSRACSLRSSFSYFFPFNGCVPSDDLALAMRTSNGEDPACQASGASMDGTFRQPTACREDILIIDLQPCDVLSQGKPLDWRATAWTDGRVPGRAGGAPG